ncbi:MAG TPA: hypothetical protein VGG10_05590 [Rhizomicrobium sp.]|jgi:hypothetical protein
MKSPEVYRVLKLYLAEPLKALGFKRAKGLLSWARPQDDRYLIFWCQISLDGWDNYAGSKFTAEFQLSDEAIVSARSIRRERLPRMLDDLGREELRAIQNRVITSLHRPPPHHPSLQIEQLRDYHFKKFQRIDQPYGEREDIWLRYATEEHVQQWSRFIIGFLPTCLRQTENWRRGSD